MFQPNQLKEEVNLLNKKIIVIANSLSIGGAERISVLLAKWFSDNGIDTYLITINKDKSKGYELPSTVSRITINDDGNLSRIKIIQKLRKHLKEIGNSSILVMGVPLSIYVIPSAFGLKLPVVISERNDPSNFSGKKFTRYISRALMFLGDKFVFQTEAAMKYYHKRIQEKSVVIPNPIMAENLPLPFSGIRSKRIVSVGRLDKQKNHKLLINAFHTISNLYDDYSLTIYGEGKERALLESLIKEKNMQSCVHLPGVSHNVFDDIQDASLFVLTSDFEGMPNALIEAMALGLPCISTDCPSGGPRSLINNMENGILVPVNDVDKMVEAMDFLLKEKDKAHNFANEATKIQQCLDKERICKKWADYILEI